ncbi:hypothetical protein GY45DRAFT_1341587 [Cubamyces sp. BRFM 1775]|nr:hypothetical protein GY45DRAFT_1341587 [Cubamyces sp. BRFM 1775]
MFLTQFQPAEQPAFAWALRGFNQGTTVNNATGPSMSGSPVTQDLSSRMHTTTGAATTSQPEEHQVEQLTHHYWATPHQRSTLPLSAPSSVREGITQPGWLGASRNLQILPSISESDSDMAIPDVPRRPSTTYDRETTVGNGSAQEPAVQNTIRPRFTLPTVMRSDARDSNIGPNHVEAYSASGSRDHSRQLDSRRPLGKSLHGWTASDTAERQLTGGGNTRSDKGKDGQEHSPTAISSRGQVNVVGANGRTQQPRERSALSQPSTSASLPFLSWWAVVPYMTTPYHLADHVEELRPPLENHHWTQVVRAAILLVARVEDLRERHAAIISSRNIGAIRAPLCSAQTWISSWIHLQPDRRLVALPHTEVFTPECLARPSDTSAVEWRSFWPDIRNVVFLTLLQLKGCEFRGACLRNASAITDDAWSLWAGDVLWSLHQMLQLVTSQESQVLPFVDGPRPISTSNQLSSNEARTLSADQSTDRTAVGAQACEQDLPSRHHGQSSYSVQVQDGRRRPRKRLMADFDDAPDPKRARISPTPSEVDDQDEILLHLGRHQTK